MLELKNITKKYGRKIVVKKLSEDIKAGESIALLGQNGAGKSTLLEMMAGLLQPDEGQILYRGERIDQNLPGFWANLGYVPQEISLFEELTALDNLNFWGKAYHLNQADLKMRISEISQILNLEEDLKQTVKNYSVGMKRRLNLGVAILHRPQLLLLDEADVGIDLQTANKIIKTLTKLQTENNTTIIYASHHLDFIQKVCQRFWVLKEGELVADLGSKDISSSKSLENHLFDLKIIG